MTLKRYIGSLLLVALMLVTTVGIGIYRHTCFVSGHEGLSIFFAEAETEEMGSCCAITEGACKKPAGNTEKKGCCEETGEFIKLDIPQKSEEQYSYQAPQLPVLWLAIVNTFIEQEDIALAQIPPSINNLPPPPMGQRLALVQIYRL